MPLVITDNLKNSLSRPTPVYKKTIELYRLVWGGAAYSYDTVIDITDYLTDDSAGTIMWKLDKENYGVFNLDNVTLTFRNERNQWKQDNPKGLFPSGKLINRSQVRIKIGGQLADGTYETLRSFTGYISGDPDYNPEDKKVTMTLMSAMSIFEKNPAGGISTTVTDEEHAYSAPGEVAFNTANNGVAEEDLVVKRGATAGGAGAATEIKPTTGFTITNQNMKTLPLTVTLVSALTATESIWITYKYWYQDKSLEWLAAQICTLCGVTSTAITPAVFSTNIPNSWSFNSQADWETCTLDNIGTKAYVDSFQRKWFLIDDFADGQYTSNPIWTVTRGSWSVASSRLTSVSGASSCIKTPSTKTSGSWEFKVYVQYLGQAMVGFLWTGMNYDFWDGSGCFVSLTSIVDSSTLRIRLGSDPAGYMGTYDSTVGEHTIRVTRDSEGNFKLYVDDVLRITGLDATVYTSTEFVFSAAPGGYITDIRFSDDATADAYETDNPAILTSPVKDCGASLTSWANLTAIYTAYGETVLIETASSSDNITWDDWTAISGSGLILSSVKRYLKFRVSLTTSALNASFATPIVDEISIIYYTSSTVIDLVNLTGMTCRQALDRITEMPAYEMGFKADETFIYQPRSTTVPAILDLTSEANIKAVRNLNDGIDRVYNRVVAQFGIYTKISDASADTEPNSITKYGTREYSVSASNLLPAENVNLAHAVAPTILAYTKTPRRRCTIESKFILHLELGDKVTVYYDEPTALRRWKWGDRDVVYGQADLEYYNTAVLATRYNLWGVVMRVEGIEFNFQEWTTSFDLVEVV